MTIGEKIRFIRQFRGITQAELGRRIDLTGDRIRQYENDVRTPKQEVIDDLAEALNIDSSFLVDHNIDKDIDIIQVLFELEDRYKLDLQKTDEGYSLNIPNTSSPLPHSLLTYLDYWYNVRQNATPKLNDTKEEMDSKISNYKEWKYQFPGNFYTPAYEEYKKLISEIQCKIMMNCIVIRDTDIPMKYSGFIELIKDMLEAKIDMIFAKEESHEGESLLVSIKYSQFESFSSKQLILFAKFMKVMELFEDHHGDCFVSSHDYREDSFLDYYINEFYIHEMLNLFLIIQANTKTNSLQKLDSIEEYSKHLEIYNKDLFYNKIFIPKE